jgi:hypothetical protein
MAQMPSPTDVNTVCTAVLALAAGIQILVYLRQASLMKEGLRVTKDAADHGKLATELCESADLQLHKYYLAPTHKVDANAVLNVTFKNFGRTTAKEIKTSICFRDRPFRAATNVSPPDIVAPGETGFWEVYLCHLNNQMTFTDYDRINTSLKEVWFLVRIDFLDVFDIKHWIEYQLRFDTEKQGFPNYLVRSGSERKNQN